MANRDTYRIDPALQTIDNHDPTSKADDVQPSGNESNVNNAERTGTRPIGKVFFHEQSVEYRTEAVLRGYINVIRVFVPVTICMVIVVTNVKLFKFFTVTQPLVYLPYQQLSQDTGTRAWHAVVNALVMLGVIFVVTTLLVVLYKCRCNKILHGSLMFITLLITTVYSSLYINVVLDKFNIPMDYCTLIFSIWNYGAVSLWTLFWKGPLRLQQAYNIINSSIIALVILKILPDWTVWTLLAVLVIWDLVAVLCPMGPLNILVKTAQERNETSLPGGLIYSSTVMWTMVGMSNDSSVKKKKAANKASTEQAPCEKDGIEPLHADISSQQQRIAGQDPLAVKQIGLVSKEDTLNVEHDKSTENQVYPTENPESTGKHITTQGNATTNNEPVASNEVTSGGRSVVSANKQLVDREEEGDDEQPRQPSVRQVVIRDRVSMDDGQSQRVGRGPSHQQEDEDEDYYEDDDNDDDTGVKLGLGDFVFYSVLVGKSSAEGDWNTTVASFIAILVGLISTLLLLTITQRALPALPISITFGLIFYFATSLLVSPFMDLLNAEQVFI